jgi:hypothetical protein
MKRGSELMQLGPPHRGLLPDHRGLTIADRCRCATVIAQELLAAVRNNQLELLCPRVILTQCRARTPSLIEGSGLIRLNAEGHLELKVFARGACRDQLEKISQVRSGSLIPDHYYFKVEAYERNARWFCGQVRLQMENAEYEEVTILSGRLGYIEELLDPDVEAQCGTEDATYLTVSERFYFLDLEDVPFTHATQRLVTRGERTEKSVSLDVASFTVAELQFEVYSEEGALVVEVEGPTAAVPPEIGNHIEQCLLFITARRCTWVLRETSGRQVGFPLCRVCSRPEREYSPRLEPPLPGHRFGKDVRLHVWDLFRRYLTLVQSWPGAGWHPASHYILRAVQDSAGALESAAAGLAIAVEGLVETLFPDIAAPGNEAQREIDGLLQHIREWNGNPVLRDRAASMLGQMKRARARDRLLALEEKGVITSEQLKAWAELRNRTVHGQLLPWEDLQRWLNAIDAVTTLMHRLVFARVGYKGPFMDYSSRGWPLRNFEPPAPWSQGEIL